jgi:transcriptional antiterminator NusG
MIAHDFGLVVNKVQPWFALRVRSKHEQVASLHLRSRGFEEFSPSYKVERQWSDRKRTADQSLFPGYVFCRLNAQDRLPVLTVPGVVGIVGFGDGPTVIPEEEVARVRAMLNSGLVVMPWPFLKVGEMVLIERGPLAGVEGILQEVKGKCRIVVSINLLQRSVSSEIDRAWVRPVGSPITKAPKISEPLTRTGPRHLSDQHVLDPAMAIK